MVMRMTNVPASYELATAEAAANFVNQAKVWLIENAKAAAVAAEVAAEEALSAQRQALKAACVEAAFASVPSICSETLQMVKVAASTLLAAAEAAEKAATAAAAEAVKLQKAVEIALTIPAINTWAEI